MPHSTKTLITINNSDSKKKKKKEYHETIIYEQSTKTKRFQNTTVCFKRFDGVSFVKRQLITLSEARKYPIAYMVHLRFLLKNGNVRTALLCCKSRVQNKLTAARVELVGVPDAVTLGNKVQGLLTISPENIFYHTQ